MQEKQEECEIMHLFSFLFSIFAECFNRICEMDFLPKDPAILVSSVNMLLRDEEFDTLESFRL